MNRQPEVLKAKAPGDEAVVTLLRIFGNAGFKVLQYMNRQPEVLKAKAPGDEAVVTLLRIFGNAGFKVLQ